MSRKDHPISLCLQTTRIGPKIDNPEQVISISFCSVPSFAVPACCQQTAGSMSMNLYQRLDERNGFVNISRRDPSGRTSLNRYLAAKVTEYLLHFARNDFEWPSLSILTILTDLASSPQQPTVLCSFDQNQAALLFVEDLMVSDVKIRVLPNNG